jgi:glucan phosphorylase
VSLAEKIIPAADLSEQISTAGMEASGTGNMKLTLNGALTIGTMDGANVEIREEVGPENIYIFGLTVDDIRHMRSAYDPRGYYDQNDDIKRVVDAIGGDMFCSGESGLFAPIRHNLLDHGDYYFHLADFAAYLNSQQRVSGSQIHSERGPHGQIFQRSNHQRVCTGYLAYYQGGGCRPVRTRAAKPRWIKRHPPVKRRKNSYGQRVDR